MRLLGLRELLGRLRRVGWVFLDNERSLALAGRVVWQGSMHATIVVLVQILWETLLLQKYWLSQHRAWICLSRCRRLASSCFWRLWARFDILCFIFTCFTSFVILFDLIKWSFETWICNPSAWYRRILDLGIGVGEYRWDLLRLHRRGALSTSLFILMISRLLLIRSRVTKHLPLRLINTVYSMQFYRGIGRSHELLLWRRTCITLHALTEFKVAQCTIISIQPRTTRRTRAVSLLVLIYSLSMVISLWFYHLPVRLLRYYHFYWFLSVDIAFARASWKLFGIYLDSLRLCYDWILHLRLFWGACRRWILAWGSLGTMRFL